MIDDGMKTRIKTIYEERFGNAVTSVDDGLDRMFGGAIALVTYRPKNDELVTDVVFIEDEKRPVVFATTQELLMFLQKKTKFQGFNALIESKMFHALIFLLLIVLIFWEGMKGSSAGDLGKNALAILGSVVGLAAGLFFGGGKK
jgi:hypothetical protein